MRNVRCKTSVMSKPCVVVFYDASEREFKPAVDNRSAAVLRTFLRVRDDLDVARVSHVKQLVGFHFGPCKRPLFVFI